MSEFVDEVTNIDFQLGRSFDEALDRDMEWRSVHSVIDDLSPCFSKFRERFSIICQFLDRLFLDCHNLVTFGDSVINGFPIVSVNQGIVSNTRYRKLPVLWPWNLYRG